MELKEVPHGTVSGYNYHRCKCDSCRVASNEYAGRKRAKLQASGLTGKGRPRKNPYLFNETIEKLRAMGLEPVAEAIRPPKRLRPTSEELFWSKVRILGKYDCWEWMGYRNHNGYGRLGRVVDGTNVQTLAHRFAWELVNGPVPVDKRILHYCDNPPCVNIEHLWLGTQSDNVQDMLRKGRGPQRNGGRKGYQRTSKKRCFRCTRFGLAMKDTPEGPTCCSENACLKRRMTLGLP
jgi:hypothetical protein